VLAAPHRAPPWRAALPSLAVALLGVLVLYRETFAAMVAIWSRSDTFAHAFLVPPIVLWLVWRRRADLGALVPQPQPWTLVPVALAAAGWLVGDLAGVNALTQICATTILVLAVPTVLGWGVARAIAFPLAFMFFMVPIGEFAMPVFMQWTADFTVTSLRLLGVPVYREGLNFVIPSGSWSVVEACSGIRYLIASFMVGTLFGYLQYRSMRRRILFALVSLAVPIVANWARALMIVLLGHFSGNRIAAGVDHLIYGWLFFGVVIGLMFFVGSRWTESPRPTSKQVAARGGTDAGARHWFAAAALVLAVGVPAVVAWRLHAAPASVPVLALPALPGTAEPAVAPPSFAPHFEGAAAQAVRRYAQGDATFAVHVAYYRRQTYGRKLASSENVMVKSDDKAWRIVHQGLREIPVGGRSVTLREAQLRAGALGAQVAARPLQVRQVLWVDGRLTAHNHVAALLAVLGQLSGRGDDAAAITFTMSDSGDEPSAAALDAAVAAHLGTLGAWLETVRGVR
jgi:exosortase A